jgi:exodeoxyribonuclease VII small subunit
MNKEPKEQGGGKEPREMKFEAALERLEQLVKKLEEGDGSLDDSLKMFEEGVGLARLCGEKLDAAERRIETLVRTEDGGTRAVPFKPGDDPERGSGE